MEWYISLKGSPSVEETNKTNVEEHCYATPIVRATERDKGEKRERENERKKIISGL